MAIENYTIGMVVSAQGLTDDQYKWLNKTLRWTIKALGDGCTITLYLPGIDTNKGTGFGLPRTLTNRPLPQGCKMVLLPGTHGVSRAQATEHRASLLATVDEVWCMPGYRQNNRLNKSRAALSFWFGVGGSRGHIYKWVPPWVDSHDVVYQPKQRELPWISK